MNCPDCKYIMSLFDAECPRCARYNTPHPAPQLVAGLPPPVAFVPSPYQPPPSDTFAPPSDMPAPPMHPVIVVFLGIMLSIVTVIVIACVILFVRVGIEASAQK